MNKIKSLLAAALVSLVIFPAHAGTKVIGEVNGLKIVRIKTAGLFAPSTTTIVAFDPAKPGTLEGVLNHAGGPGFIPAVATAGGVVGGAALLRPDRTHVSQSGGGGTANAGAVSVSGSSSTSTGGGNQNGATHHNN